MKKSFIKFALLFLGIIVISAPLLNKVVAQGSISGKQISQSPYYDAIALYYAFQGYNAYPVPIQNSSSSAPSQSTFQSADKPGLNASGPDANSSTVGGKNPGLGGTGNNSQHASNAGDSAANMKTLQLKYTIIESSTGKILLDNFSGKLDSLFNLKTYQFSSTDRTNFIYEILARNANTTDTSEANILKIYKPANTYLSSYLPIQEAPLFKTNKNFTISSLFELQNDNFSTLGGGGPSFTDKVIQGYTDYLVDALNAEIDDALFIHLEEALSNPKYPELKILFPTIVESLSKVKITNYTQSLNTLKSAYQQDIKNILSNISNLATVPRYHNLINDYPALTLVFVTCELVDLIKKGTIPADILFQISNTDYIQKAKPNNYSSSIKLAALISYCLRDIKLGDENANKVGWVDQSKLNAFVNNHTFFKIFMGLFAQNADSIIFTDKKGIAIFDFQDQLFKDTLNVLQGQFIVYNFSKTVNNISNYVKTANGFAQNPVPTSISTYTTVYINIANQIIGLANNCMAILPSTKTTQVRKEIQFIREKYIPILTQANTVLTKIEAEDYNMAIYETDTLLQQIFVDKSDSILKTVQTQISNVNDSIKKTKNSLTLVNLRTELANLINQTKGLKEKIDHFNNFQTIYVKYGAFIASIASAKSESDVKTAINAFALPTGSSRIKKEHNLSIGLNSYVGFYWARNAQYSSVNLPKNENGITAPLGLSVNWGWGKAGALSAYLGIIDVGAIFTYKINNDSSLSSNIQLAQILSPSVGLVYGFPIIKKYNFPISIGIISQWGPRLQTVSKTGNSVLPLLTQRFNLFIAIDLPFLNFYVSKN